MRKILLSSLLVFTIAGGFAATAVASTITAEPSGVIRGTSTALTFSALGRPQVICEVSVEVRLNAQAEGELALNGNRAGTIRSSIVNRCTRGRAESRLLREAPLSVTEVEAGRRSVRIAVLDVTFKIEEPVRCLYTVLMVGAATENPVRNIRVSIGRVLRIEGLLCPENVTLEGTIVSERAITVILR